MQFIRDKLTYEEVKCRFEREGYTLLSAEYNNAKSHLKVLCPRGHEWVTSISNFDFGRRCSVCSRKKKHTLDKVKDILAKEGYQVQDSIYINGITPIKVTCPNGHESEVNLNNFMNGRRCCLCNRMKAAEARRKKLAMKQKSKESAPRRKEDDQPGNKTVNEYASQVQPEWLDKLDEMRKNLKSGRRRTYRE